MIQSRITAKSQTTVPQAVRRALGIRAGDSLEYEIEGDRVVLRKARAAPADDPFVHFDEWAGDADSRAYADF
jgi:antitoxin PrlF